MACSDQIADFLTRIRNAVSAQHRYVDMDWSKIRETIAGILKSRGFIENFLVVVDDGGCRGKIRLFLKYANDRQPAIQGLKRVSKPGLRKYVGQSEIPRFYGNMGLSIVSTSQGVLPGDEATKRGIGGELMCLIW